MIMASSSLSLFAEANYAIAGSDSVHCGGPAANAGADHIICAGESARIGIDHGGLNDSNLVIFSWSPAEGLDDPHSANPNASPLQSTTYVLSVQQIGDTCIAYDTVLITVKQPATLMFFPPGPHSLCEGQQVTLTGAMGFSNYHWSGPSGTQEGRVIQAGQAGVYRLSATDAQGCLVQADSFELHVRTPIPIPTNPSGIKRICTGQTAQFIAGQGFIAYNWHTPTGTVGGRFLTASVPGNYYVSATDANSCLSRSATIKLEVNSPAPIQTQPANPAVLCQDESLFLSAPEGFQNYFWIGPSGQLNGRTILVNQAGYYQVKAFDSNGCLSVSDSLFLQSVQPAPIQILADGALQFCRNTQKLLSATEGFSDYQWTTPSGMDNGSQIQAVSAGMYAVRAFDNNHCLSVSDSIHLTYYPEVAVNLNHQGDTTVCKGDTLFLQAGAGLSSLQWIAPSGTSSDNVYAATEPGLYAVSGLDSNSCRVYSPTFRLENFTGKAPFILSDGSDTLCPGEVRILTCSPGFSSVQWHTPAGISEGNSFETTIGGLYSISATDSNGCKKSSALLNIRESFLAKPQLYHNHPNGACSGDTVRFYADTIFSRYAWSDGAGTPFTDIFSDAAIFLQVYDQWGCSAVSDTLSWSFQTMPQAAFTYVQDGSLPNIQFYNQSEDGLSWLWDFGDGQTSLEKHPSHVYSSRGNWSVSLIVSNECGSDTLQKELKLDSSLSFEEPVAEVAPIALYPNPGNENLLISWKGYSEGNIRICIQDLSGRVIFTKELQSSDGKVEINTQSLRDGVYVVTSDLKGKRSVQRWIKR